MWGDNSNKGAPEYFKGHAEAQARQFASDSRPITGYVNMYVPHSPAPRVPLYGPAETTHILPGRNFEEWNSALGAVKNISSITYIGHSG